MVLLAPPPATRSFRLKKDSPEPLSNAYTSSVSATAREAPFRPSACRWLAEKPFPRGMSEGTYSRLNLLPACVPPTWCHCWGHCCHTLHLSAQPSPDSTRDGSARAEQHPQRVWRGQECRPCSATSVGRASLDLGLGLLLQQGTLSTPAQIMLPHARCLTSGTPQLGAGIVWSSAWSLTSMET